LNRPSPAPATFQEQSCMRLPRYLAQSCYGDLNDRQDGAVISWLTSTDRQSRREKPPGDTGQVEAANGFRYSWSPNRGFKSLSVISRHQLATFRGEHIEHYIHHRQNQSSRLSCSQCWSYHGHFRVSGSAARGRTEFEAAGRLYWRRWHGRRDDAGGGVSSGGRNCCAV